MPKTWFRRLLVVLALAIPATAYAAERLSSEGASCCSCPMCPGCDR